MCPTPGCSAPSWARMYHACARTTVSRASCSRHSSRTELERQASWFEQPLTFWHYREADREVDVIAERPLGEIVGVEVKASATVRAGDFAGLRHLRERVGERMVGGAILYAGAHTLPFGERTWAIPLQALWTGLTVAPISRIGQVSRRRRGWRARRCRGLAGIECALAVSPGPRADRGGLAVTSKDRGLVPMSVERGESVVEMAAMRAPAEHYDVAILGGGLAGLTLSIQLKLARPQTRVVVLEKREGPAPLAAFKVGESTVACGAHYFSEVVGMREHLQQEQLKKCGLRYFLPGEGNEDITRRAELGVPFFPPHDNFQLDRGLFENKLAARARALGVDLQQGARVREVELGGDAHRITFEQFDGENSLTAHWIVDAAGRAGILKRKLELAADCGHHINSAWIRLGEGLILRTGAGKTRPGWRGCPSPASAC